MQVWNINPCTAVVGAFNVQGATWKVKRRAYVTHDPNPKTLPAVVRPADVPVQHLCQADEYALFSDSLQELRVVQGDGGWEAVLAGGGGYDLFTISPVIRTQHSGVAVAPIGLINMLNCGGAVRSLELQGKHTVTSASMQTPSLPCRPSLLQRSERTGHGLPRAPCTPRGAAHS